MKKIAIFATVCALALPFTSCNPKSGSSNDVDAEYEDDAIAYDEDDIIDPFDDEAYEKYVGKGDSDDEYFDDEDEVYEEDEEFDINIDDDYGSNNDALIKENQALKAEKARLEEKARQAELALKAEQARKEKARQEQARQEQARQDKARQDKARQDEQERNKQKTMHSNRANNKDKDKNAGASTASSASVNKLLDEFDSNAFQVQNLANKRPSDPVTMMKYMKRNEAIIQQLNKLADAGKMNAQQLRRAEQQQKSYLMLLNNISK